MIVLPGSNIFWGSMNRFFEMLRKINQERVSLRYGICFLFTIMILFSCSVPQHYPPCISEKMHELTISWGDHDIATGKIEGFRLDAMGNLYEFIRASDTSVYVDKLKRTLPDSLYCHINKLVIKEILKAQTLNSAIDTERFVEYRNPEAKAVMRASWNPKFETKGNKGFLELYDYLSRIVGDIK
jgi:hypothetical protein